MSDDEAAAVNIHIHPGPARRRLRAIDRRSGGSMTRSDADFGGIAGNFGKPDARFGGGSYRGGEHPGDDVGHRPSGQYRHESPNADEHESVPRARHGSAERRPFIDPT